MNKIRLAGNCSPWDESELREMMKGKYIKNSGYTPWNWRDTLIEDYVKPVGIFLVMVMISVLWTVIFIMFPW